MNVRTRAWRGPQPILRTKEHVPHKTCFKGKGITGLSLPKVTRVWSVFLARPCHSELRSETFRQVPNAGGVVREVMRGGDSVAMLTSSACVSVYANPIISFLKSILGVYFCSERK